MTKFREGDVVWHIEAGYEESIERVSEDFIVTRKANGAARSLCRRTTESGRLITLLRRPVRVGDVLVYGYGSKRAHALKVSAIYTDMMKFEDGAQMWLDGTARWDAWRHADGTVLEPTTARDRALKPPDADRVMHSGREMTRATMESMLAKDPIGQAALAEQQNRLAADASIPTYEAGDLLQGITGEWFTILGDAEQTDPNYVRGISGDGVYGFFQRSVRHVHVRRVRHGAGDGVAELEPAEFDALVAAMRAADAGTIVRSKSPALNGDVGGVWKPEGSIVIGPPTPARAEAAPMFAASCRCGHTTKHALGTLDPQEGRCTHSWRFDRWRGVEGGYECTNCQLWIDQRGLAYASDGATTLLSDEARHTRLLFETDPEVIAYVRSRSDDSVPTMVTRWNTELGRSETVVAPSVHGWTFRMGGTTKYEPGKASVRVSGPEPMNHMQTAWTIGEAGNRPGATKAQRESVEAVCWKRAVDRAAAMHEKAARR